MTSDQIQCRWAGTQDWGQCTQTAVLREGGDQVVVGTSDHSSTARYKWGGVVQVAYAGVSEQRGS
jgi:hypothetical protein